MLRQPQELFMCGGAKASPNGSLGDRRQFNLRFLFLLILGAAILCSVATNRFTAVELLPMVGFAAGAWRADKSAFPAARWRFLIALWLCAMANVVRGFLLTLEYTHVHPATDHYHQTFSALVAEGFQYFVGLNLGLASLLSLPIVFQGRHDLIRAKCGIRCEFWGVFAAMISVLILWRGIPFLFAALGE